MSLPRKMTVKCSKCGHSMIATVFESINSDYAADIPTQIISGELFNARCPHCQFVSHLEYDVEITIEAYNQNDVLVLSNVTEAIVRCKT